MERGRMRNDKQKLDKIVGANIRNLRVWRKMSRDELAELIDLTVSHLGLIERGERGATSVVLNKLVKAFGITIDDLFREGSKSVSAREAGSSEDMYRKKVESLLTTLSEPELVFISEVIKSVSKIRKSPAEA